MEINYLPLKKESEEILEKLSNTTDSQELAKLGRRQAELLPLVNKIEIAEHEKLVAENQSWLRWLSLNSRPCNPNWMSCWNIYGSPCCRGIRMTTKILLWKSGPGPGVTKRDCLPASCSACIPNMPKGSNTKPSSWPPAAPRSAATKK